MSTSDDGDRHRRIGQKLRAARLAAGISQTKLGEALGVSFQQVQKYERGANRLSAAALQRTCDLLGIESTEFLADRPIDRVLDVVAANPSEDVSPVEILDLLQAFTRIRNPAIRRSVSDLIFSLARPDAER